MQVMTNVLALRELLRAAGFHRAGCEKRGELAAVPIPDDRRVAALDQTSNDCAAQYAGSDTADLEVFQRSSFSSKSVGFGCEQSRYPV